MMKELRIGQMECVTYGNHKQEFISTLKSLWVAQHDLQTK